MTDYHPCSKRGRKTIPFVLNQGKKGKNNGKIPVSSKNRFRNHNIRDDRLKIKFSDFLSPVNDFICRFFRLGAPAINRDLPKFR